MIQRKVNRVIFSDSGLHADVRSVLVDIFDDAIETNGGTVDIDFVNDVWVASSMRTSYLTKLQEVFVEYHNTKQSEHVWPQALTVDIVQNDQGHVIQRTEHFG